jgi:hypothetical protein
VAGPVVSPPASAAGPVAPAAPAGAAPALGARPPAAPPDRGGDARDALGAVLAGALLATVVFVGGSAGQLGRTTAVVVVLLLAGGALVAAAVARGAGGRWAGGVPAALLFALAALSGLSILWAVQPAAAWAETNVALAYAAAFTGAIALARLAPRGWRALVGGVLIAAGVVTGYALLTKSLPAQLDAAAVFARLRQPYEYWNAVGLTGALAVPACLWLGARREGRPLVSALAFPVLGVATTVVLLAYSRGSLLAAAIGCALWFALVPLRLRGAAVLLLGAGGGVLAAVWAFGQRALSADEVPLAERAAAGGELAVLLAVLVPVLYVAGLAVLFAADARPPRPAARRRIGTALLVALALAPVAGAGALAATDDGLGGSLDRAWSQLTDPAITAPSNDPGRLTGVASVRARYWRDALAVWELEPALGVGAGGFGTARARVREDRVEVVHAHGQLVQVLADLGLVGLGLTLAVLAAWAAAARRAVRGARGAERAGLVTLTAIAVVFGAHALVDWTWSVPGTAAIGVVCAGFVAGRAHPRETQGTVPTVSPGTEGTVPSVPLRRRLALAAGVAVLTLVAVWAAVQPARSASAADAALVARDEGRVDEARALAERARERNPLAVEPLFALASVEERAGRRDAALRALEAAADLQPANPQPWLRLAEYRFRALGQPEPALRAARAGLYLDPRSFELSQLHLDIARRLEGP